ncbi:non-ribosomal peptide synthetase [Winogradskyella sp. PE311]|uniref:non-ribosomal peptide synthetase n=1 Tax=Winogradskyella sp. PE311 TaxID=3366943 RepID=UPI003980C80E
MKEQFAKSKTASNFSPFSGPEIDRVMYTTQSQAEIWVACKLGSKDANRAYNESISLILEGDLDRDAISKSVQNLVNRHEALRSVYSTDGRIMTIFKALPISIEVLDVSDFNNSEKDRAVEDYLASEAHFIFDLLKGPLFKVGLIKLSETEHHLILTAHHIVCDGWSMGVMLEELGKLYSSYVDKDHHNLPDADSFYEYAKEQQAFLDSEAHKAIESYWLNLYKDEVPQLTLPTDFPRPVLRTFKSGRLYFPIQNVLIDRLKKTGIKGGSSLVSTLLSVFEVFISDQSGQDDIVVGLPSADQAANGKRQMIGHCVNLLPLRTKVDTSHSFIDYLKQRKSKLFDAYDHQKLSFGELLQKLPIARDPSRVPLVPVVFNIDTGKTLGVSFSGLNYKVKSNPRAFEAFEIFLNATGSDDNLTLEWSYNSSLFKPETIEKMSVAFHNLIEKLVESPDTKLQELLKVDCEAYDKLNETASSYPKTPLHQLIAEQAKRSPNKQALKFRTSEITYKELENKINTLAHCLQEQRVKSGDIVAVALPRSIELVVTLLAIMQCGGAYLPLDPNYPQQRLDFMLNDSGAEVLISTKNSALSLTATPTVLMLEDLFSGLEKYPNDPVDVSVNAENMLYLLYTSGSTGNPKGVKVTHQNLVNLLYAMFTEPGINENDRLLSVTTISFDIAGLELFLPLVRGASLIIADEETAKDTRLMLEVLEEEDISILQATPSTYQMLLDTGWEKRLPLKILCCGEALPMSLATKLMARVDELWNMYGPTETTIYSAGKQIKLDDKIITIGRPIANTQAYVLNDRNQLVAPGKIGELCIAGDGVAQGYWKRDDLTSEKFINNPFNKLNSPVLYKTGDLVKLLPSGEIQCLGRKDNQVKIRGHRIELGEIEDAINSLDEVETSVVVVIDDKLISYIVSNKNVSVNEDILVKWKIHLKESLPSYMVPHAFHILKEFPTTLNGKIDRKALNTTSSQNSISEKYTAPRTEAEKLITTIWSDALNIKKINIYSDFFELGGHSLLAVRVMSRLEKETGQRLPLSALMTHSTIEKLAQLIEQDSQPTAWSSLVPIKTEGDKTPVYVIHGAEHNVVFVSSIAKYVDKNQPIYGIQAKGLNGIDKPFDRIEDMAAHYISEILKTNPNGPIALAGYSFGGIVAFEMVRQLKAMGKDVESIILIDCYVFPSYMKDNAAEKKAASRKYTVQRIFFLAKKMFRNLDNFKDRIDLIGKRFYYKYLKLRYGKEGQHKILHSWPLELDKMLSVAVNNYHIKPMDVEVNLLKVSEDDLFFAHDKDLFGWGELALGGVKKFTTPGNHNTLLSPPNDKSLAKILQVILDTNSNAI